MKKSMVFFFLMCIALGEWQQADEISLPKGIQVNDLTISNSGELWVLSSSSILKYETATKSPVFVQEMLNGKLLAVYDKEIYIVDNTNQLITFSQDEAGLTQPTGLFFNYPIAIAVATVGNRPFVIVQEPNKLTLVSDRKLSGSINTSAEKLNTIPAASYDDRQTPFFTLENNQIYAWTGGSFSSPERYRKRIMYSASSKILDFATNRNGNLYILFSDSIVVLEPDGDYKSKISTDNVPLGSRLFLNPANNNIAIFDQLEKSVKVLSGVTRGKTGELITLFNNQPNPVDNYTEIPFTINETLDVTITVYNLIGEPVKIIAKDRYPKGTHRVVWRADDEEGNLVPNGIYFYRLESNKGVAIKQLIVLR